MELRILRFETEMGPMALAATETGVARVWLPESPDLPAVGNDPGEFRAEVVQLAERLAKHLDGDPHSFEDASLDLSGSGAFSVRVYHWLRTEVGPGKVVSYGDIASALGVPGGARAVAGAMSRNPVPLLVPCHRVLGHGGRPGGFSGGGGLGTKARMLHREGVVLNYSHDTHPFASLFEPMAQEIASAALAKSDPSFAVLVGRVGDIRLPQEFADFPFVALAQSICYQQLAGRAAATIFRRFEAAVGRVRPEDVVALGLEGLKACGLSASKSGTMLGLARVFLDGTLKADELESLPYSELEPKLTAINGIGPWTVQMFAIFHRGLPDVFPPADLGIRKALAQLAGQSNLPSPAEASHIALKWRPFRTMATWMLWRSL